VIVLIGENRIFDHLFATYVSPSGEPVKNLLLEGIIRRPRVSSGQTAQIAQNTRAQKKKARAKMHLRHFMSLQVLDTSGFTSVPPTLETADASHPICPISTSE